MTNRHPETCLCTVRRTGPKTWWCPWHGWYNAGSYYGFPCPCIKIAMEANERAVQYTVEKLATLE